MGSAVARVHLDHVALSAVACHIAVPRPGKRMVGPPSPPQYRAPRGQEPSHTSCGVVLPREAPAGPAPPAAWEEGLASAYQGLRGSLSFL